MQFNLDEEAFRFWDDMLCEVQRDQERRCASVDRNSRSDRNLFLVAIMRATGGKHLHETTFVHRICCLHPRTGACPSQRPALSALLMERLSRSRAARVMAAAMGGATTAVVATIPDGPEVAATTMAGVTIAIGDLTQSGDAASVGGLFIWAKRACRLL